MTKASIKCRSKKWSRVDTQLSFATKRALQPLARGLDWFQIGASSLLFGRRRRDREPSF